VQAVGYSSKGAAAGQCRELRKDFELAGLRSQLRSLGRGGGKDIKKGFTFRIRRAGNVQEGKTRVDGWWWGLS